MPDRQLLWNGKKGNVRYHPPMQLWCKMKIKKGCKTVRKGPYVMCENCSFKELV